MVTMRCQAARRWLGLGLALAAFASAGCGSRALEASGPGTDRTPPIDAGAAPGARAAHAMVYVSSRASALLFGGCCSLDDMWDWIWVR